MPRRLWMAHWTYFRVPLETRKSHSLTFCTNASAVIPSSFRLDDWMGLAFRSTAIGPDLETDEQSSKAVLWTTQDMLNSDVSLLMDRIPDWAADRCSESYMLLDV